MSHYAVAVFSDDADFERLLAPYSETDEKYFQFIEKPYEEIVKRYKAFRKHNRKWTLQMYLTNFKYIQNEERKWGYRCNPNGYWDYYTLDGRGYMFDLKKDYDEYTEAPDWNGFCRKNDYDWYPKIRGAAKEAKEFWDKYVASEDPSVEIPSLWSRDYYLERYKTKEQYVKECVRIIPYAFITPDGVWHSSGRVGFFAYSDETADDWNAYEAEWDAFIQSEANPYVSLVDCHI